LSDGAKSAESSAAPKTDDELLSMVQGLRAQSVGFEQNGELYSDRERALNYIKGEMDDLPVMDNRSQAISTDVNDAIETALPDLVDIFTGGDEVAAFQPVGPEDEDKAQQETDYINHVFFQENNGFLNIYTIIKDALQQKIGVGYVIWERDVTEDEEKFEGKNAVEMQMASQDGEIVDVTPTLGDDKEPLKDPQTGEGLFSFTLKSRNDYSCAKVLTVPPEDFTVSADTVDLAMTPYCAMRTRPRAQDLIADGVDADIVKELPAYGSKTRQGLEEARDTASENDIPATPSEASVPDESRVVEVLDHYVRILAKSGDEIEIWRVRTGAGETVLIDKEKVSRIPFAAGTPYPVTHRFYGRSLADLLMEIQKIKTVLTRATLDSAYFALNQRLIVGDDATNDFTISDVLNNVPGMPIRAKNVQGVAPIPSPGLGFDAFNALEYFSTVAEQRTGIVRNAQGLNPDTLHDTAAGALALMTNSQKRLRLIARVLGETCLKPLFLLLHAVLRENATEPRIVRLNQKWVPVDPSTWAERNDLTIEIGVGAAGREHDIQGLMQLSALAEKIGESPYGAQIITPGNVYNMAATLTKKLGFKTPEKFFTDPSTQPPAPPQPNPEMMKVQGDQQLAQAKMQADQQHQQTQLQANMQLEQMKVQSDEAIQQHKAQTQAAVDAQQQQLEHQRMMAQQANEMALEQVKIQSAERIAIAVARINAEAKIEAARVSAKNQTDDGASQLAYQESHETV
jgi:hypothetical protein